MRRGVSVELSGWTGLRPVALAKRPRVAASAGALSFCLTRMAADNGDHIDRSRHGGPPQDHRNGGAPYAGRRNGRRRGG
jgi:hypothetical protein